MGRTAKVAVTLFCLLFIAVPALGAAPSLTDFTSIDQRVANTPASAEVSVKSLASYFSAFCKTDTEKARAIYDWITLKIDYDSKALKQQSFADQYSEKILKTRKAVCGGYAELFADLAKAMKLEQVAVSGYSRGVGYSIGKRCTKPDHAWNAVKIDGEWQLIDSAWGAGHLDSKNNFVHDRNYHYFLTPPDQFIFDHFPEEQKWQLLNQPVDKTTYEKQVCLKRLFFDYNLEMISHRNAQLIEQSKMQISIKAPDDVLLTAEVHQGNAKCEEASTLVKSADGNATLYVSFPKTGNYLLRLYAARKDSTVAKFDEVATYSVKVNAITQANSAYPNACDSYYTNSVALETPMDAVMELGKVETFKLKVPNAEAVQVIVGNRWYKLAKDGDTFEGEAEMDGSCVSIGAKFPDKNQYIALVEYKAVQKQTAAR